MITTVESVQVPSPKQQVTKANPIETLQKTVSASRLNCWLSCRLKFFFRYVQEIAKPPTPALHVGSVVRRIRTMCAFTTRGSCERILFSVFDRINQYWTRHPLPAFTHNS
jgi:hypothetical protein